MGITQQGQAMTWRPALVRLMSTIWLSHEVWWEKGFVNGRRGYSVKYQGDRKGAPWFGGKSALDIFPLTD